MIMQRSTALPAEYFILLRVDREPVEDDLQKEIFVLVSYSKKPTFSLLKFLNKNLINAKPYAN